MATSSVTQTFTGETLLDFPMRSRGSTLANTIDGSVAAYFGSNTTNKMDITYTGGNINSSYTIDRMKMVFNTTEIPTNVTLVSATLTLTSAGGDTVTDSAVEDIFVMKGTNLTEDTSGDAETEWNAIDKNVHNGAAVTLTGNTSGDQTTVNLQDDLLNVYMTAQVAAGNGMGFWVMTKMEKEGTTATGTNVLNFWTAEASTESYKPTLSITYNITTYPTEFNRGSVSLDKGTIEIK